MHQTKPALKNSCRANWDDGYRLLLGNETTGDRPWVGTLHLVARYERALIEAEVTQNFNAGHEE